MLNIAVVGFGFMGMLHTGNILKISNINLSAIVDKNTDAIHEKLALQLGNFATKSVGFEDLSGVKIYDDFAKCLKAVKLDVCVIAVHTNLHYEIAKMALEAGLHVFLEKPFCLDVNQGQFLIDMAIEKNKILMIGHVVRFMPAYQTLKSWIDSREFGNIE